MDPGEKARLRAMVLEIPCPECPAGEGEPCTGARPERNGKAWTRETSHPARIVARADGANRARARDWRTARRTR